MHSQKKEFKPIYGSFSGREAIEMVTSNTQKNMPQKVPFNIGFPSIKRGGAKIKGTFPKPQDCVIIPTQTSSTLITNGNRSKPSITTQADKSAVNSQVASSISNKSTSASIQTHSSSLDKSPTTTVSPNSHIQNANNAAKNGNGPLSTSIINSANYSRSIPNCSTSRAPINTFNSSNVNNSQQNNVSNSADATKSNSLIVQSQQKNGFVNGTVWNGVNSKVVNPLKESSPGSTTIRPQHINSVAASNQHQPVGRNSHPGNKTPQYGSNNLTGVDKEPFLGSMIGNISVVSNNSSNGNSGKTNTVWNGINGSLKEPSGLANVTQQIGSIRSSTSNGLNNAALKEQNPSSIKYKQQKELDNKNNTSSVTSTPSSSRRSSESNGSNAINNVIAAKDPIKHVARQVEADNKSNISSISNTPSSSRRPSESNESKDTNSIVESNSEQRNDVNNNATTITIKSTSSCNIKHSTSDGNTNGKSPATASLLSSEKNKNNGLNSGSTQVIQSSNKQPSNERSNTENATMGQLSLNGAVPSGKPMNWAVHLFSKDENQKPTIVAAESSKSNVTKPPSPPVKPQRLQKPVVPLTNGKPKIGGLAGLLKDFDPSFQNLTMSPRGLVNNGNMCFMNAILQTLSHCPPFCNLLTRIHKEVAHSFNSKTPLVDSLVRFIDEYKQMKRSESSEEFGEAFSPEYVYDALRGLKRFDSMKGRQEDAEEFLGFLLDGLHEEFLAALKKDEPKSQQSDKAVKANVKSNQKDDVWMEVGPKNRTSYTRTTDVEETPISRIFGGQFRSVLSCPGSTDSITLQPYQSLQLDIQPDDVKTIGDALKNLTVPEHVDDFYSPKNGLVRATKRLYIETLPPILTLHLKRFVYDNVGGTQKLSKHIGYSTTLSIQPDIMAQARRPNKAVEYRLFGVVYHHGKSATGGHYTADILCRNDWLHIDDAAISSISSEEVASVENPPQPTDRSAYILFYMRN